MPWDSTVNSTIVAIHAGLTPGLPRGEIIYFAGFNVANAGQSFRYGCDSGEVTELTYAEPGDNPMADRNLFCAGHAHLPDGRWLVAGGWAIAAGVVEEHQHGHGGTGIRDCFAYLPRARTWQRVAYMNAQPDSDLRGGGRWYPTLVTIGNGQVIAVGGHPLASEDDMDDTYPATPENLSKAKRRHSNNIPERYVPGLDSWISLHEKDLTAPHEGVQLDEYDRLHLAPNGHVFFSTLAKSKGDTRLYNPSTGRFADFGYGTHLNPAYDDANCAANTTSIILPILPSHPDRFWVMTCGAIQPERIDLLSETPHWETAGARQSFPGGEQPPIRNHLLAIILPTGQVFVACGMRPSPPFHSGVQSPEIYTPAIDWTTGMYTDGEGTWETLTDAEDQATVERGYHSVALLQPDGSVWCAGSTEPADDGDPTNPGDATAETRIEVFRPGYDGNRPQIESAPQSVTYGEQFDVIIAGADAMDRVVLIRCGSFTHAFDNDQRYLTLSFAQSAATLRVTAPRSWNLAPPGTYMLFVLRGPNRPSQWAKFIRLAEQDHYPVLQLSTYSLLAVKALRPPFTESNEAVFAEAIELIFIGYLPHELNYPADVPIITLKFGGGGGAVPGMRIELRSQYTQVDAIANPDTPQKYRFVYDVIFDSEEAFVTFDDDESRPVDFRAVLNGKTIEVQLILMKKANPFMKDGDPAWLSTDLRVHRAQVGDVNAAGGPQAYIQQLLDGLENSPAKHDSDSHPFDQIGTSPEQNSVVLAVPEDGEGIYNFAIARVRYLSVPGEDAVGVKVFFRLFNTVGTALMYNPQANRRLTIQVRHRLCPGPPWDRDTAPQP